MRNRTAGLFTLRFTASVFLWVKFAGQSVLTFSRNLMIKRVSYLLSGLMFLTACTSHSNNTLLGTLEWDRIGVVAEAAEPILQIAVREGDVVHAGDLILTLDVRRTEALLAQAQADVHRLEAQLAELKQGPRGETIDAARAMLNKAESAANNAKRERKRLTELHQRGLVAQVDLDQTETLWRTTSADANAARANLDELLHGTRHEIIDQIEAALASAQAHEQHIRLARERLDVRAPRDGKVDALPFKLGDQPPLGATVVSLLTGTAPYARIYVPASRRAQLSIGAHCQVHVQSIDTSFAATLRSIRSDPAFTPYYALTGDDASQLVYRAELALEGEAAQKLPAGLPLQAECQ